MNRLQRTAGYLLLAASVGLGACSNDLTEYNPSGITSQTVFTTPDGFESLVNASYAYARWWYGKEEGIEMSEMGTDLWTSGGGDHYPALTTYDNLRPTDGALTGMWQHLYAAVNLVNGGIAGIDDAGLTPAVRDQRLAELHFLRAFYYWHIVETWGGVYLTTTPTTTVQTELTRSSVDDFYQQIFTDLDYAVAHLSPTTSDYGRITKWGAVAFEARMYLTRGEWQKALDLANDVIQNSGAQLMPSYTSLWDYANEQNPEVLWAVTYSDDKALDDARSRVLFPGGHPRGGNNGHLLWIMNYYTLPGMQLDVLNGRPFNRFMPTEFLLDLYNEKDDSRYDVTFQTVWYANSAGALPAGMQLGDTAVYTTKYEIPEAERAGKVYTIFDRSDMYKPSGVPAERLYYPSMVKFMNPTLPSWLEQVSGRDAFVIRLAEMYLIAGEAEFRLGNVPKAADYINVVRERAAVPGHEAAMKVSASQIDEDFILNERAREFAGEQLRWFDLKRTGKLVERVKEYNPDIAPNIQDYMTLRPVPQHDLDAITNPEEFEQNPGYN